MPAWSFQLHAQAHPERGGASPPNASGKINMASIPKEIFKAYDIRGIVGKTLTNDIVEAIGHAIGSEAVARRQHSIAIGRDGRLSGPGFAKALARGIQKSGVNVIDVGRVATPMTYFAAYQLN